MLVFLSHLAIDHHRQLLQQIFPLEDVQQIVVIDILVLVNEFIDSLAEATHNIGQMGGCLLSWPKFNDFSLDGWIVLWVCSPLFEIFDLVDEAAVGWSAGKQISLAHIIIIGWRSGKSSTSSCYFEVIIHCR